MSVSEKNWNLQKTMVGELPLRTTQQGRGRVLTAPGFDRLSGAHPSSLVTSVPKHPSSDLLDGPQSSHEPGRTLKNIVSKAIVSPSFLLSSLLVFLFVPDAVLKRQLSIDLRTHLTEVLRRMIDIVLAGGLLLLLTPVFLVVPILIKLDSPGTVIYRQVRVGQNRRRSQRRRNPYRLKGDRRNGDRRGEDHHGMLFMVYKFRSMREDAEKKSGPVWARKGDPRVTKVGKILRATRADELPQLFNILKGEMSFVGPRPERPYFVNQFVQNMNQYTDRLQVKPGLTGLAQVMGGYDTCEEDVHNKLQYDLSYIRKRSLIQDMKIIFKTIGVVLTGKGVYE